MARPSRRPLPRLIALGVAALLVLTWSAPPPLPAGSVAGGSARATASSSGTARQLPGDVPEEWPASRATGRGSSGVTEAARGGPAGPAPLPPPVADAVPVAELGPVRVQEPALLLTGVTALEDPVAAAMRVGGVSFATSMELADVEVTAADGRRITLRVAEVDPAGLRVLVPQATADALAVWQRLRAGELVVDHRAAEAAGLSPGDELRLADGSSRRVGAVAATARTPYVHALVASDSPLASADGDVAALVALRELDDLEAVERRVAAALGGATPARLLPVTRRVVVREPSSEPPGVWDELARCESSGRWHLDTGNGYYGGLQFLPSSWHLVGGQGLPHEHSRDEQILRARLLLAIQGWQAWPVCSRRLGLR